jgi:hypothetical protein
MTTNDLLPKDFARGVVGYSDNDPTQTYSRIVIPVRFDGLLVAAMVDTGAPYCILDPEAAAALSVDESSIIAYDRLTIRGHVFNGGICRLPITLMADRGDGLTIDATVFIPSLEPGQLWTAPNFLGLGGFLERLRFAVDPFQNLFYFGTEG